MSTNKMLKNERKNRQKAIFLTVLFHLAVFGAIGMYSNADTVIQYLPASVQEWLPASDTPQKDVPAAKSDKPRV